MSSSNTEDLLGLFGTPAKPAQPPNPFDTATKPKPAVAMNSDKHFDELWEQMGGSPKPSAAAPKLTPGKSFRMESKKAVSAPVNWADFDAAPAAGKAAGAPAVTAPPGIKEWGMHDESDEEDEDVGETAAEFDLLGLNAASAVGGARARRRSSVALASLPPGARRSSAVGDANAVTGIAAAAAAATAASSSSAEGGAGAGSSRPSLHIEASTAAAEAPVGRRSSVSTGASGATGVPGAGGGAKKEDSYEGTVWCRTATALIIKRWKERFCVLRNGIISVWTDKPCMLRGDAPLETVAINARQALTTMKVNQTGADGRRLFYRCVVELDENQTYSTTGADNPESSGGISTHAGAMSAGGVGPAVIDEDDVEGSRRVFKFGLDTQSEFEKLTRALRAAIETAHAAEREKAAHSMALAEATNAADLFRHAIASPRDRPKRRSSVVTAGPGGGTLNIPVRLLDGTLHHVMVARGASVKDVLVSLRRIIGLKADGDFSLFLRTENPSTGHDTFACLPDVMSAEEAEAMAAVETRSLVFKRRIYLPPLSVEEAAKVEVARRKSLEVEAVAGGSGGGLYNPELAFDLPDVDTEAQAATSITDGAHSLLYMEAVFHVSRGYYLLPLQDCLILAGLQLISQKGRVSEADRSLLASNPSGAFAGHPTLDLMAVYKPMLAVVLSAQAIAEHKATSGKAVDDLLMAIRKEHARLSTTLDAFAAQRVYIKRAKQLPEYGGATFFAAYQRLFADVNGDPKGSRSAAPTPAWAESVTCEDIHAPSAPKPMNVVVIINAVGIHIRPLPPWHNPSLQLNYSAVKPVQEGGDKLAASLSHELSDSEKWSEDGKPIQPYIHRVEVVEVWGVKKSRPTFTYRVRENQLRIVELTSPSFKEMASTLHQQVFALLAQREGKVKRTARAEASDYGSLAQATKAANREAEQRALDTGLPSGWSTIQDSATGQVAFWNSITKQTVFSRPTA